MPNKIHRLVEVSCYNCGKIFPRDFGRYNEAIKLHWRQYCSGECQKKAKNTRVTTICSRVGCKKNFQRTKSQFRKFRNHFCSQSCSAIANNLNRSRKTKIIGKCLLCKASLNWGSKYCSPKCQNRAGRISENQVLNFIRSFFTCEGRIPMKREYAHCHAARFRFGTWNNAIKATGFDPNPVMFANKHTAKDGHGCDSFTEKIIDDWLFKKGIEHKRNVPYPGGKGFTCDFVIGNRWIEFFGLAGELKKYDTLKRRKLNLVRKYGINLIKLFPNDIFPKNKLGLILESEIISS